MKIKKENARLANGEQVEFYIAGNGPRVVYIVGAGSFYLSRLKCLYNEITFVTCDRMWTQTYGQQHTYSDQDILSSTAKSLSDTDVLVIKKIKEIFGCKKIGVMGFSAPAGYALLCAKKVPDDIGCVILTGAGLAELDPNFTGTDAVFKEKADATRVADYERLSQNYKGLKNNDLVAKALPGSHLNDDGNLSDNSDWIEGSLTTLPKALYEYNRLGDSYLARWRYNSLEFKGIISKTMRMHYFGKIQPTIDTLILLKEFGAAGKHVLVINGLDDYITYADPKIIDELKQYESVKIHLYPQCGHSPMEEKADDYAQDVNEFIALYLPMKALIANLSNTPQAVGDDNKELGRESMSSLKTTLA